MHIYTSNYEDTMSISKKEDKTYIHTWANVHPFLSTRAPTRKTKRRQQATNARHGVAAGSYDVLKPRLHLQENVCGRCNRASHSALTRSKPILQTSALAEETPTLAVEMGDLLRWLTTTSFTLQTYPGREDALTPHELERHLLTIAGRFARLRSLSLGRRTG